MKNPRRYESDLPRDVTETFGKPSSSLGFSEGFGSTPAGGGNQQAIDRSVSYSFKTYSVNSQATAQILVGGSALRKYLAIQNNGTVPIYLGFGTPPDLNGINSFVIPPNAGITFENKVVPANDVYVISSVSALVCVLDAFVQ